MYAQLRPYSFFFSSRGRHTSCLSDWSSDVCSSDLALAICGCQVGPSNLSKDLSQSQPDFLCTSSACAAQPCTPDCIFEPMSSASCPASMVRKIGRASCRARWEVAGLGVLVEPKRHA